MVGVGQLGIEGVQDGGDAVGRVGGGHSAVSWRINHGNRGGCGIEKGGTVARLERMEIEDVGIGRKQNVDHALVFALERDKESAAGRLGRALGKRIYVGDNSGSRCIKSHEKPPQIRLVYHIPLGRKRDLSRGNSFLYFLLGKLMV